MDERKEYITLEDGWGTRRTIPRDKLQKALEVYEEMREIVIKSGRPKAEADKFTWRIVEDSE